MFCPRCGKEIPGGARFCTSCGWRVPEPERPRAQTPAGNGRMPRREMPAGGGQMPRREMPAAGSGKMPPKKGGPGKWIAIFLAIALGGGALFTGGILAVKHFRDADTAVEEEEKETAGAQAAEGKKKEGGGSVSADAGKVAEMSEEEFYAVLEEKYGALLEEETPGPGEGSLYAALEEVTEIKYSEPAAFPAEAEVTVTGPDMYAMLSGMDIESFGDEEAFRQEVLRKISAGEYEKKTVTVTAELEGPDLWAAEDYELLDALYGGTLRFYREKSAEEFRDIAEKVGGTE